MTFKKAIKNLALVNKLYFNITQDEVFKNNIKNIIKSIVLYKLGLNILYSPNVNKAKQVTKLIDYGLDFNVKNKNRQTLLMWAAQHGFEDLVDKLIKKNANVNDQDKEGNTALMYAVSRGYSEIVEKLIKAGANIELENVYKQTALNIVTSVDNPVRHNTIKFYDYKQDNPIINPININNDENNISLAQLLAMHGDLPMLLNKSEIYLNARFKGNIETFEILIKAGANINHQDVYGNTPLMNALNSKYLLMAEELINAGANVSIENHDHETALSIAYSNKKNYAGNNIGSLENDYKHIIRLLERK